jgi:hypothetical protein
MVARIQNDTVGYKKLRNGAWGLLGVGLIPGDTVTVTRRDGATRQETVGSILWADDSGLCIATILRGARSRRHVEALLPVAGMLDQHAPDIDLAAGF